MKDRTIPMLQIELAKLGVDNLMWGVLAGNHAVTLISEDRRITGFGVDMVHALEDAIGKFISELGADIVINRYRESRGLT
jgi:hypothetical protein